MKTCLQLRHCPKCFSGVSLAVVVINSRFMFSGVNYPNFATFVNVPGNDFLSFCHVYHFATFTIPATFATVCVVVASRCVIPSVNHPTIATSVIVPSNHSLSFCHFYH